MKCWVPLVLACCVAGSVTPAAAQFTSAVIPPPAPVRGTAAIAERLDSAQRPRSRPESSAAATLASMKQWVDSAAEALSTLPPASDTTPAGAAKAPAPSTAPPTRQQRDTGATRATAAGGKVTRFHNGARAPDTATPLPLLALLGLGAVVTGALLRRR